MAKWASASMIRIQSIWWTTITNSAQEQIKMCLCKTCLAFTIKTTNRSRPHSSMSTLNPLSKHSPIQQTKVTATRMVVDSSKYRHLCSSISHLRCHSSSCRLPNRCLSLTCLVHQGSSTRNHGLKNWTKRISTSSTSNRTNYLTSISTGTRSSCLDSSASKQQQTLVIMEVYSLLSQFSASQWALRKENSRNWTFQNSRRRVKLGNRKENHIQTSKFLSKRESRSKCQRIPEQETITLKIKHPKPLVWKDNPSKWIHPLDLASNWPKHNHQCS